MLRNLTHAHPVAFDEEGKLCFADVAHPAIDAPELPDDQTREAGRQVALWLLRLLGPKATVAKLAGLRYAFRLERKPMEEVAREYGITRAAISKQRVIFCNKFGLPAGKTEQTRQTFSRVQAKAWKARKESTATHTQ